MKKLLLSFLLTGLCLVAFAQEDSSEPQDPYFKKHEIKANALYLVVGAFDFSYEYLLNEESGLGMNVFIPYDSEITDEVQYYLSPYYRFYFGKKYGAGFFLEGFGILNSIEPELSSNTNDFVTDFGLGIGLGGKWVTKGGFVGEVGFGVARNLFNTEASVDFVSKLHITLGYRF